MIKTCFVVMAIGEQSFGNETVTAEQLRSHYDDLIKEALLKARPNLEITRADDVAAPGAITSDILTRIMHSDLVVADVTYPNPNVYYELGLRHASKNGTIIIRDSGGARTPFDISNLRHIEYSNTATGLKQLSAQFKGAIDHFDRSAQSPDSSFQEIAKLTNFKFPDYGAAEEEVDPMVKVMTTMLGDPDMAELLIQSSSGKAPAPQDLFRVMSKNPAAAGQLMQALSSAGHLDTSPSPTPKKKKRTPRTGG